jgi:hypothetical protein
MTNIFKGALALLLAGVAGIAGAQSIEWPQDLPPVPEDKAQIIFVKPGGGMWASWPVGVLEIVGEQRQLVGVLGQKERVAYEVSPGKHRFMSHITPAVVHFLDAEVEAGKRYVVLVRFIYGNGFQLRPIRPGEGGDFSTSNPEFAQWLSDTDAASPKHPKVRWYQRKDKKAAEHQAKYQVTWDRKTDAERAELTLGLQDAL